MAMIGVMTAVTCIAAPFSIPIPVSPVPLSLTTFILYLSVYILGTRNAFISYVIYLLLGLVGLPVFSGFSGGFAKLAGPTGGYLIGFLFMIPLTGILFEKTGKSFWKQFGAMVLGTLVCYLFGTVWLCLQLNLDFIGGLGVGKQTVRTIARPGIPKRVRDLCQRQRYARSPQRGRLFL